MKLRHVPLLLVREMARHASHRGLVAQTHARVIQRADELAGFMAIYWADARGIKLVQALGSLREKYHRILIIIDERLHDRVLAPSGCGYVINVASARNGVGYGAWTHIDGWSEAVVDYIRSLEADAEDAD